MGNIYHALVLNLHQPSGNLEALLDSKEWHGRCHNDLDHVWTILNSVNTQ